MFMVSHSILISFFNVLYSQGALVPQRRWYRGGYRHISVSPWGSRAPGALQSKIGTCPSLIVTLAGGALYVRRCLVVFDKRRMFPRSEGWQILRSREFAMIGTVLVYTAS